MSVSAKMQAMIDRGLQLGMSLSQIQRDSDYREASREHAKTINDAKLNYRAEQWLANGNEGAFKTARERENAMAVRVTNDRGKSVLLYDVSPEYRQAVQTKMEKSSFEVCGVMVKPDPLSPQALLRAAQEDHYHAVKQDLFDKSNSTNKVEATAARLKILELAHDPAYQEVMQAFEVTERETKPYETWLKENGPVRVETMTTQAEADAANEAHARNPHDLESPQGE